MRLVTYCAGLELKMAEGKAREAVGGLCTENIGISMFLWFVKLHQRSGSGVACTLSMSVSWLLSLMS